MSSMYKQYKEFIQEKLFFSFFFIFLRIRPHITAAWQNFVKEVDINLNEKVKEGKIYDDLLGLYKLKLRLTQTFETVASTLYLNDIFKISEIHIISIYL